MEGWAGLARKAKKRPTTTGAKTTPQTGAAVTRPPLTAAASAMVAIGSHSTLTPKGSVISSRRRPIT